MVRQIVIETETPGDSRTMFRLRIDSTAIAEGLTAVQAHLLVGEILERIVVPKSPSVAEPEIAPAVATPHPSPAPRRWAAGRGLARLMSHAWALEANRPWTRSVRDLSEGAWLWREWGRLPQRVGLLREWRPLLQRFASRHDRFYRYVMFIKDPNPVTNPHKNGDERAEREADCGWIALHDAGEDANGGLRLTVRTRPTEVQPGDAREMKRPVKHLLGVRPAAVDGRPIHLKDRRRRMA